MNNFWTLFWLILALIFGWLFLSSGWDMLVAGWDTVVGDGSFAALLDPFLHTALYGALAYILFGAVEKTPDREIGPEESIKKKKPKTDKPEKIIPVKIKDSGWSGDVEFITQTPFHDTSGITYRLERHFKEDPRIVKFEWNSGYPYTTGESSGNSEELEREGAIELTTYTITVKAPYYKEVLKEHDAICGKD